MIRLLLARALLCSLMLFSATAAALADGWVVAATSGSSLIYLPGNTSVKAAVGTVIPAGSTIATGKNARVKIVKGMDAVLIRPGSVIAIASQVSAGMTATLLERRGDIELDIEKRQDPHFSVETPFLAVVVKGTHFTVRTTNRGSQVSVSRGIVRALALATGQSADIRAGQQASANRRRLTVAGSGVLPSVIGGEPRAPVVNTLGQTGTNGATKTESGCCQSGGLGGPVGGAVGGVNGAVGGAVGGLGGAVGGVVGGVGGTVGGVVGGVGGTVGGVVGGVGGTVGGVVGGVGGVVGGVTKGLLGH